MKNYGTEQSLFLILVVFLSLVWITCLLRAWVKIGMIRQVTADDYLMLGSLLVYTAYAVTGIHGVINGIGASSQPTSAQASIGLRSFWACEVMYAPLTLLARTSVAVFLLRIAVHRLHRRIIIGVMAAFWATTIPMVLIIVFQCQPISYFWTQPIPGTARGSCLDPRFIYIASILQSAISACSDWALGVLPIVILWKVQLNKRTKLSLSLLLSMGMFAGVALIVRTTFIHPFDVSADFLYETIQVANWSVLEPGICITAGCLVTLRPLFRRWGWAGTVRSPHQSLPCAYRQTGSSHSRGARHGRGTGSLSGKDIYTTPSLRTNRTQQAREASARGENYNFAHIMEELDEHGKDTVVESQAAQQVTSETGHSSPEASAGSYSHASNISIDSALSTRFESSSLPVHGLRMPPASHYKSQLQVQTETEEHGQQGQTGEEGEQGQQDEREQQGQPWQQWLFSHQRPQRQDKPSPLSSAFFLKCRPASLTLSSPPSAADLILSPSNQILVETTTEVTYEAVSQAQSMPTISSNSVSTMSGVFKEDQLPRSLALQGQQNIQISGPDRPT